MGSVTVARSRVPRRPQTSPCMYRKGPPGGFVARREQGAAGRLRSGRWAPAPRRPQYFHLRGIPDCAWCGLQATTAWDDPTPTHPPRGKNHSRCNSWDALCHGSIKPSSLAPLTVSAKPFPLPILPIVILPHPTRTRFPPRSPTSSRFHHHARFVVASIFPFSLPYYYYCITSHPPPGSHFASLLPLRLASRCIFPITYRLRRHLHRRRKREIGTAYC